jgi:hypothetical protein
MSRIQLAGLTNEELARYVDTIGVAAATPEDLQHVALRFIAIMERQTESRVSMRALRNEVTPVSFVHF